MVAGQQPGSKTATHLVSKWPSLRSKFGAEGRTHRIRYNISKLLKSM